MPTTQLARRFALLSLLAAVAVTAPVDAQSGRRIYNQDRLEELLYGRRDSLELLPEIQYRTYVLDDPSGNSVIARHRLYMEAGDGNAEAGRERLDMVAFLNRVYISDLGVGDTLVLPSHYDLDPRAYSPFPRHYDGAQAFSKLFVIHKGVQAWAAYEHGRLVRWGLSNTGEKGVSETPGGRYNFNWKEVDRVSTLSPPGETWRMRYVFNFYDERGIHVHQYQMPTGAPASHGCVRLILADARWIYDWADGWRTSNGGAARGLASRGRILRQGTTVLVLGTEPNGPPQRFHATPDGGVDLVTVDLPADPYTVPAGSPQQRQFDRQRRASS